MKVLVLGFTKMTYMPYMHFYLQQLEKLNCEVHLLFWNRDKRPDSPNPKGVATHIFDQYQEDSVPLIFKISNFYKYRKYATKILKRNFDLVVVLHSTPGVLLSDVITKFYSGRYILDYRDLTYENYAFYKGIIHKLVCGSAATFVSSDAYREFLPKHNNIFTSHNLLPSSLAFRDLRRRTTRAVLPIRIRFWGLIRHQKINQKVIDRLANDPRFEVHYHGREQRIGTLLKNYCSSNHIENIFFHGEYLPDERLEFVQKTDLLHNIYENDATTSAMSNKYYDGVAFYIPQLCNIGSYMGARVARKGVGAIVNPETPSFAEDIHAYYHSINWGVFERDCDADLEEIVLQFNIGIKTIDEIVNRVKAGKNVY